MCVEMAFSRILPLLDCHKINRGTNSENPRDKNLDLRVKMCFAKKQLFLGEKDVATTYLKGPPKSKYSSAMLVACSW